MLSLSAWTIALLLLGAFGIWIASVRLGDVSLVDRFWGPAFVLVAGVFLVGGEAPEGRRLGVFFPVALWGLRLGIHLTRRNWGKGEDPRYTEFRKADPEHFWWKSLGTVFGLQAVLVFGISAPLQLAMGSPEAPEFGTLWDGVGLSLFAIGWFFEVVGDWQLARFKAQRKSPDEVLDRGLWALTRHPNYFGDATLWWGFFALSLSVPGGIWTLPAPVLMNFLLLEVSGARLLESDLAKRKPAYRDYVARVPRFIPWPLAAPTPLPEEAPDP